MIKKLVYVCMVVITMVSCTQNRASGKKEASIMENELTMIVGTYTDGNSEGIYTFKFNTETADSKPLGNVAVSNPSYLTPSEDGKFVYSVSEHDDGKESVHAFVFDNETGKLTLLNSQPAKGEAPCYIIKVGNHVITANYSGGSISVFPLNEDGSLLAADDVIEFTGSGKDKERQEAPHLHCVMVTPDGKYLFANDLGTDHIYKFNINKEANSNNGVKLLSKGNPASFSVEAGSGPRHTAFSPNGKYAYLINELGGTVIAFEYSDGILKEIQTVVADTLNAQGSADIHISPDGKFLYATNRLKGDGVAIFSIDKSNGKLTRIAYQLTGTHPRNFIITPNGKYLLVACRDSNVIEVFERDIESGLLKKTDKDIKVDQPVCLKFVE